MKVIVNGRNIELTEAIKQFVTEKMTKLQQHYDFVTEAHVFLSVDKNPSIKSPNHAEATLHMPGSVVRVSSCLPDMYASVDELVKKLERGLNKHKTKLVQRSQGRHHAESIRKPEDAEDLTFAFDDEEDFDLFDVAEPFAKKEETPALTP